MKDVNQKRLFVAACLELVVTAVPFAIRARINDFKKVWITKIIITKMRLINN